MIDLSLTSEDGRLSITVQAEGHSSVTDSIRIPAYVSLRTIRSEWPLTSMVLVPDQKGSMTLMEIIGVDYHPMSGEVELHLSDHNTGESTKTVYKPFDQLFRIPL